MAGLCAPLSTLRQYPHGYLRMTRGRCGSLLLHRDGLAPSTPCRSPGALRFTLIGEPNGFGDHVRFSWGLGPDGGDSPIKGTDFAVLSDGRIRSITGFLDQVPAA